MKTIGENIQVAQGISRDDEGQKIEPEQVPAAVVSEVVAPMSAHGGDGQVVGNLKTAIIVERDAATIAQNVKTQCSTCKYFDRPGAQAFLRTPAGADDARDLRETLITYASDDERDEFLLDSDETELDNAVRQFGFCRALSEIFRERMYVLPEGGCPAGEFGPNGENLGELYTPRDGSNEKKATWGYDAVMKAAKKGLKP